MSFIQLIVTYGYHIDLRNKTVLYQVWNKIFSSYTQGCQVFMKKIFQFFSNFSSYIRVPYVIKVVLFLKD